MVLERGCRVALSVRDGNDGRTGTTLGFAGGRWSVKMDDEGRVLTWHGGQLRRIDGPIPLSPGLTATLSDPSCPPQLWSGWEVKLVRLLTAPRGGTPAIWACLFPDDADLALIAPEPTRLDNFGERIRGVAANHLAPLPLYPGGPVPDAAAPPVARPLVDASGLPGFGPPSPECIAAFRRRVEGVIADLSPAPAEPRWQACVIVTYADGQVQTSVVPDVELTTVLAALAATPGIAYRVEGAP